MKKTGEDLIHFFKMSGSGNDFIAIDNRAKSIDADCCQNLVRSACRRKFSVGADGLILIENDPECDFKWRFFNADGSEAEMCGNGARCAARFALLQGIVTGPRMNFRTLAGIIEAEVSGERVKIRMPSPHSMELDFPLELERKSFSFHSINTGVPHAVTFLENEDALRAMDVFRFGRAVRYHSRFQPAGSNANFALVRDAHHMANRTYERGVEDETYACGTGTIASVLVAGAKGFVASPVEVETGGGEILTVYFSEMSHQESLPFGEVRFEGSVKVVYAADLWRETINE